MDINNKLLLLNFNHCNDSRKCLINYSVYNKICRKKKNHSGVGSAEMVFGSLQQCNPILALHQYVKDSSLVD